MRKMKILLTNDDGVRAPCLQLLKREFSKFADVYVVAPLEEKSTTGHSLTLKRPIAVEELEASRVFGVDGFPADCVTWALGTIFKDAPPDVVISGINRGGNLAQDVFYSGTAAAAREGSFAKIPSMAVSLCMEFAKDFKDEEESFLGASKFVCELLKRGIQRLIPSHYFLNVNIPYLKVPNTAKVTLSGLRLYRGEVHEILCPRNRRYYWVGTGCDGHGIFKDHSSNAKKASSGDAINVDSMMSDCEAVDVGVVSVTPLAFLPGSHESAWNSYLYQEELMRLLQTMDVQKIFSK
ncbi:MAG: 5'/3'-nucleotidase SurE [Oligoflexia bacterium]|nr:5'/3'-nucleotidase SurE [Oligoflexia bacterium]MBF0367333.1 5'/3'-nucleotidase SurE [Oligoflexia bacterium]